MSLAQRGGEPEELPDLSAEKALKRLYLVGSPNVGKSLLFNNLTGAYATVSNYPGTTVEVTHGRARFGGVEWGVTDTPGMYSLVPASAEERVTRALLLGEKPDLVLHVVDARNLERMLALTLQLIETGAPLVLVLNVMDEAEKRGIRIDVERLRRELGIPVFATAASTGQGVAELREGIAAFQARTVRPPVAYSRGIESALREVEKHLGADTILPRALALLYLQGEGEPAWLKPGAQAEVERLVAACAKRLAQPAKYLVATQRQRAASHISARVLHIPKDRPRTLAERLNTLLINPWTGVPVLLLVLYLGLYQFVGNLGAGVAVDFLENTVFDGQINPVVKKLCAQYVPWVHLRELIAGEYGVITLGLRYAIGIILPIVGFFFIIFAILEDTGYLPRLAFLVDRVFKALGLSGRGVIPIVLGLGCDTMATMVTRTLPTVRERIIGTLLLALAVPCSAQLGLILALLQGRSAALLVWAGVVVTVFLLVGFLAARLVPGEAPHFYMELPPLRLPSLRNVVLKSYTRVVWYLKEVIPLFLLASVLIWLGQLTGLFGLLTRVLAHPAHWIGLPESTAQVFLFGFFRRDYGAAGLYDINRAGGLDGIQLTVAAITLTLFLPCIAQFLMNVKERGWKIGVGISMFILLFSFTIGFLMNRLLAAVGARL